MSAMSSPAVGMCSADSVMSEGSTDITPKSVVSSDKFPAIKKEVLESATQEPRPKGSQAKKSSSSKGAATSSSIEEGAESANQQQSSSRKKRARATPSEEPDTNGRKSVTECSGRESSLWPGGEGEGPVQGSLLEEVLAEKRMALMRSPQVIQFLQHRQLLIQASQQQSFLHPHTSQTPHFCVGEVEEDANS